MGLLKILKKTKEKEKEMRLLILGLDNAGKTTILKKFNGEDIDKISPTLGFNIKTLQYEAYKLNVWDVGGQTTIRSYWRNYFEQTDGLIWVVDSSDKMRLQDYIAGSLTCEEIKEYLALDNISTRHWGIIPCSAVTGDGLLEGVDWIVMDIASRIFMMN
ncbi:hypothetical protein IMG5_090240 [Ichthyophthirius multifiliis]|uniref:ADP-ribosylation factor-like protein 2 n=1 Tax=Ichthyophthirius multifiliis TaxID=5932 RepID=G0QR78_ICHMU|nr:hypothetical protein IMG5_090240 [Ichthyophthirius multifiliis]EGR32276.1 hypothetical protein IMG5_090240 [Ichthyophthirius multifiliis]|eukprot:XP_004035762.1 hypothetical protein IMG5_090240 [Ichthyophthirius multifiliis]